MKKGMTKTTKNLLLVAGLMCLGGTVFAFRARPKAVTVVTPVSLEVTETIAASGRLRGETESNLGAPNGGRVAEIFVHEGDRVRAKQPIARIDSEVLSAQVTQAQSAVQTARTQVAEAEAAIQTATAQLQQASRPPLAADVARLKADVEQNIAVAKAKLAGAKQHQTSMYQRSLEMKNGARSEEIEQAQTQVQQAEVNLAQLERDWNRQQSLYRDNAVARAEVERAETNFRVGQQTLENARSRLKQSKTGNRPEDIAQARADDLASREDVIAAEANLSGAKRSGEAQMQSLLATPRPEDVSVAKQRLQQEIRSREVAHQRLIEAETALGLANRRFAETLIVAPFAGTVTQVVTEVGAIAGQNAAIVRLVRTGQPEIRVDLDESNLGRLRLGQEAFITNDAFPDARFGAKVSEIGAQVDTDRGTVEVRLIPVAPPDWMRPGQTFTVNIVLGGAKRQWVVPSGSVGTVGGVSSLLGVENGKIIKKSVKTGPSASQGVPIFEGITPETQVVVDPTGLAEGDRVIARRKTAE